MMAPANFYAAQWSKGTGVSKNGDVFAFYLPSTSEEFGDPVVGGGEFVTAFSDRPEVQAFQTYLSSDTWAKEEAKATPDGGWVSANKGLDVANLVSPIDRLSAQTLPSRTVGVVVPNVTRWLSGPSSTAPRNCCAARAMTSPLRHHR